MFCASYDSKNVPFTNLQEHDLMSTLQNNVSTWQTGLLVNGWYLDTIY